MPQPPSRLVRDVLVVMRHGEREDEKTESAMPNPGLTREGKADIGSYVADHLAPHLRDLATAARGEAARRSSQRGSKLRGPCGPTRCSITIKSSPFLRCVETSQGVAEALTAALAVGAAGPSDAVHFVPGAPAKATDRIEPATSALPVTLHGELCEILNPSRVKGVDGVDALVATRGGEYLVQVRGELPAWPEETQHAMRRFGEAFSAQARSDQPFGECDVNVLLVVTHGDALGAINTTARTSSDVYQVNYLAYMTYTRYGRLPLQTAAPRLTASDMVLHRTPCRCHGAWWLDDGQPMVSDVAEEDELLAVAAAPDVDASAVAADSSVENTSVVVGDNAAAPVPVEARVAGPDDERAASASQSREQPAAPADQDATVAASAARCGDDEAAAAADDGAPGSDPTSSMPDTPRSVTPDGDTSASEVRRPDGTTVAVPRQGTLDASSIIFDTDEAVSPSAAAQPSPGLSNSLTSLPASAVPLASVRVRMLTSGNVVTVTVDLDNGVDAFRRAVQAATQMPWQEQRVAFGGRDCTNSNDALRTLGVADGAMLFVGQRTKTSTQQQEEPGSPASPLGRNVSGASSVDFERDESGDVRPDDGAPVGVAAVEQLSPDAAGAPASAAPRAEEAAPRGERLPPAAHSGAVQPAPAAACDPHDEEPHGSSTAGSPTTALHASQSADPFDEAPMASPTHAQQRHQQQQQPAAPSSSVPSTRQHTEPPPPTIVRTDTEADASVDVYEPSPSTQALRQPRKDFDDALEARRSQQRDEECNLVEDSGSPGASTRRGRSQTRRPSPGGSTPRGSRERAESLPQNSQPRASSTSSSQRRSTTPERGGAAGGGGTVWERLAATNTASRSASLASRTHSAHTRTDSAAPPHRGESPGRRRAAAQDPKTARPPGRTTSSGAGTPRQSPATSARSRSPTTGRSAGAPAPPTPRGRNPTPPPQPGRRTPSPGAGSQQSEGQHQAKRHHVADPSYFDQLYKQARASQERRKKAAEEAIKKREEELAAMLAPPKAKPVSLYHTSGASDRARVAKTIAKALHADPTSAESDAVKPAFRRRLSPARVDENIKRLSIPRKASPTPRGVESTAAKELKECTFTPTLSTRAVRMTSSSSAAAARATSPGERLMRDAISIVKRRESRTDDLVKSRVKEVVAARLQDDHHFAARAKRDPKVLERFEDATRLSIIAERENVQKLRHKGELRQRDVFREDPKDIKVRWNPSPRKASPAR